MRPGTGLGVLRHGALPTVFEGGRAPSTVGTFPRAFTHGHALQLRAVQVRAGLAALRDEAASKGRPPLIWTRANGYQLGAERAALEAYERQVIRES